MPDDISSSGLSVIRRKTRVSDGAGTGGTALTRLWHVALPRIADDVLGLPTVVRSVSESREAPEALCGAIPEDALVLLLSGPGGRNGLAMVDAGLLAALTEVQMTGHVSPAPPSGRRPTPTDAAICSAVLDAWIDAFEAGLTELAEPHGLAGLRQAPALAGARAAEMALGPEELTVTRLALDLGEGAKQGLLTLAAPPPLTAIEASRAGPLGAQLKPVLMESEAVLTAILHRSFLPYGRISTLAPGDTIDLPHSAIGAVTLETVDQRPIVIGRLGQAAGARAIRIDLGTGQDAPAALPELAPLPTATPEAEALPDLPDLPLPEAGAAPDLPLPGDLPPLDIAATELPEIDLPSEGDIAGEADPLPDLPDLPPLPDLPDIPQDEASDGAGLADLPDLPDLPIAPPPLPDAEDPA